MEKNKTIQILRVLMPLVAIASLYFFVPWILIWAWLKPLPDTVQEEVDSALNYGFDGIIVYVDESGKAPAFYSSGWHNRDRKIKADPQALFKIASIGKLYVALAITKLVSNKRLSLEKSLAEYFPKIASRIENSDKITLSMMVQHRSGIPSFTENTTYWIDPPQKTNDILELALDKPAIFEAGEDYGYSNTNYLLLGLLMDSVLGYNHQKFIKEEILEPNQLNNTFFSIHDVDLEDLMSGYYVGVEQDIKLSDYGSMVAKAEDVGDFLRYLNDGSIFKEGEQEIYSSLYVYNHTGLVPGYQSFAKYYKDIDTVVVQFVNTTNFEDYTWSLADMIFERIGEMIELKGENN